MLVHQKNWAEKITTNKADREQGTKNKPRKTAIMGQGMGGPLGSHRLKFLFGVKCHKQENFNFKSSVWQP